MTDRLAALHRLMQDFEPDAITTDDIWSYLWGKLGYGAMLFAQALGQTRHRRLPCPARAAAGLARARRPRR